MLQVLQTVKIPLTIIKDNKYKLGLRVACIFVISFKKDLKLLNSIKEFFEVGNVFFPLPPLE
jgi:hypothetical protein